MRYIFFLLLLSGYLWATYPYTNALIKEDSPYLQQHAHNPVNWYAWGEEAFAKAKKEHKPIFVSIGYSTCHWCHVMEEESFSDENVAKLLNDNFVSIKVDREQYPQIDKKYQHIYKAVHGKRGGWPLSIFMTANKEVFFMGTYIPSEQGYGVKGLVTLLPLLGTLHKKNVSLQKEIARYKNTKQHKPLDLDENDTAMTSIVSTIAKEYDAKNGGFGTHPKFPEASKLGLLLDIVRLSGNKQAFLMAQTTLRKMALGGIYDQIHGGFFRYSIDSAWNIPHFEKMLYTNAQLIEVYVKMYEMTDDTLYKKVIQESIDAMQKHYMQQGVYLSASDADSDGVEGGYFIYEYAALKSALTKKGWKEKELEDALSYLGIEEEGNIDVEFSQPHITREIPPSRVEALKHYLRGLSAKRTFPFIDKKINTAWNAMMIKALFKASTLDECYLSLAQKSTNALLKLMLSNGVLYHQRLLKKPPSQKALLEDYAFLIDALIEGYERTYEKSYLDLAKALSKEAVETFYKANRWYLSNDEMQVEADFDDRYYTAPLSVMLHNLLSIASLTNTLSYRKVVHDTLANMAGVVTHHLGESSKLALLFIRVQKGDIIVHASREKLRMAHKALDNVKYPFLLSAVEESDEYLACKMTMCFAHEKNITKLIEKIHKAIE